MPMRAITSGIAIVLSFVGARHAVPVFELWNLNLKLQEEES